MLNARGRRSTRARGIFRHRGHSSRIGEQYVACYIAMQLATYPDGIYTRDLAQFITNARRPLQVARRREREQERDGDKARDIKERRGARERERVRGFRKSKIALGADIQGKAEAARSVSLLPLQFRAVNRLIKGLTSLRGTHLSLRAVRSLSLSL